MKAAPNERKNNRGGSRMTALRHLFSPVSLGSMQLENRLVMPPMSVNFGVDDEGFMTEQHIEYLRLRAEAGTGMIVVGGGAVHPDGLDLPRMPPVWDDKYIPALSKLTETIHRYPCKIGMQLLHGGRQAFHGKRVAPSPLPALGVVKGIPRELSNEEVKDLVGCHGDAAERCLRAGFDFVEIHAAHGYLISEFMAPLSNVRSDEYGGSFENRIRFLREILKDIKSKCGKDYPVGVRYNGDDCIEGGFGLEEAVRLGVILEADGADWLHISAGIYGSFPITIPSMYSDRACFLHLAEAVKKAVSIPVIAVGRIKDPVLADRIIAEGRADLVALGRPHLADERLAAKARNGELNTIRPCIGCCKGCIDRALALEEATCVVNPAVSREYLFTGGLKPADPPRRILVIGGGPAALCIARLAAERGHDVIIIEQCGRIGGMLAIAAIPPGRKEMMDLITYHVVELERLGVEIRLNVEPDTGTLHEISPDVVVVATGAMSETPQIEGLLDTEMELHTAQDVLEKSSFVGDRVIILGGGMIGLMTADFLAEKGREVTVLNRDHHFAPEMSANDRTYLRERLKRPEIRLYKSVVVKSFTPHGLLFETGGKLMELDGFDDFIIAEKMRSMRQAADWAQKEGIELHIIGDAKSPRTLLDAMTEADELGRTI